MDRWTIPLSRTVASHRTVTSTADHQLDSASIVSCYRYGHYFHLLIPDKDLVLVYIPWPFYIVPYSVLLYLRTTQSSLYYVESAQRHLIFYHLIFISSLSHDRGPSGL